MNQFRQPQTPPVSEGQEVDVTVESVGDKGDGVAKVRGFVIFVPSTQKGDRVRIRVKKVLANVAFAEKIGEATTPASQPAPQPKKDEFADIDVESLGEGTEDFGEDEE